MSVNQVQRPLTSDFLVYYKPWSKQLSLKCGLGPIFDVLRNQCVVRTSPLKKKKGGNSCKVVTFKHPGSCRIGTGSLHSQSTSHGPPVPRRASQCHHPQQGSTVLQGPIVLMSLGYSPKFMFLLVFDSTCKLYNLGGNILVPRAFYLPEPRVSSRRWVRKGTNKINSKKCQVARFHNSLKS